MFKRGDPGTGEGGDCNNDPPIGPIGSLDEPVTRKNDSLGGRSVEHKRWIEITLIGLVLLVGLVSGALAFTALFVRE